MAILLKGDLNRAFYAKFLIVPFSGLATKQRSKLKHFFLNQIFLWHDILSCHFCLAPMWENHTRFAANCRERTNASAKQLVPPPCASDLKAQSLIKLSQFIGGKLNSHSNLGIRRNNPSESKNSIANKKVFFSELRASVSSFKTWCKCIYVIHITYCSL